MHETQLLGTASCQDAWDVLVVGAGPAGTVAARQLALQGHQMLLVEKARIPRFKVCGGCLGGVALDVLGEIGLADLPAKCGAVPLTRMRLADRGMIAEFPIGRRVAVSRGAFDAALVCAAARAGVIVCDDTKGTLEVSVDPEICAVRLRHQSTEIVVRAKVVLMATGLSSCPSHCTIQTQRSSYVGLGTLLDQRPDELESETLYMARGSRGYVGIATVDGGRLDVAAALDPAALAAGCSPGQLIDAILRDAGLRSIAGLEGAEWRGTPRLTRQTRPVGLGRCLLIGDAAGYAEPFTGEGIGWAMRSAVLASALVHEELDGCDECLADRWNRLYTDTLLYQHRRCRLITSLLRSNALSRCAVWSLGRAPFLARPIVRRLERSG